MSDDIAATDDAGCRGSKMHHSQTFVLACLLLWTAQATEATTITFAGTITQGSGGSAGNNPSLNNINYGDAYSVTLGFAGSISGSGTYSLSGGTLVFSDPAAPASESGFSSPVSITVSQSGATDDISVLGCLTSGSGCLVGNFLAANFSIPVAGLNQVGVAAQTIFGLSPALNLLEDDGATDVQGVFSTYSYSAVPVPPSGWLLSSALVGLMCLRRRAHA